MRLQLISFAWRILNTPVACFAAVSSERQLNKKGNGERTVAAPSYSRGSDSPGFKEKKPGKWKQILQVAKCVLESKAVLGGSPFSPKRAPRVCSPPGPCPSPSRVLLLVSAAAGLAPGCGCTNQAAKVWHVRGAVPCPFPLQEIPQVPGMSSASPSLPPSARTAQGSWAAAGTAGMIPRARGGSPNGAVIPRPSWQRLGGKQDLQWENCHSRAAGPAGQRAPVPCWPKSSCVPLAVPAHQQCVHN